MRLRTGTSKRLQQGVDAATHEQQDLAVSSKAVGSPCFPRSRACLPRGTDKNR